MATGVRILTLAARVRTWFERAQVEYPLLGSINNRLIVIFLLGFSSGLPLALVTSTLQAWFAYSGMPILLTGALSLIGLPYAWRFLWGPILDRYPLFKIGKRRSWILVTQIILFFGFNAMTWLSPLDSPELLAFLALLMAFFSATQDMVIDAHRAEYLPIEQHALGASVAVIAYRVALFFSGGFALILAQKLGWAMTYRIMGLLMLVGICAVLFSREPEHEYQESNDPTFTYFAPLKELFLRPGLISIILFIFFYKLGESFTTTTSGIVMPFLIQGLGFSLETIGYINKILGIASIILGGIIAGLFLMRYSLYKALFLFGLLQAFSNIFFVILAIYGKSTVLLAFAVVVDNCAAGLGSTALVAFFMRYVNKNYTGTQFSILVALSSIPRIVSGPFAALLQINIGWVGVYELSVFFALLFIPFLIRIKAYVVDSDCKL